MGLDARDSQRLRSYGRFTKTAETKLKNMAVSGYLWLRMMVVASSTVWRVVAPATSSGELSPFFFFFSLSFSLSLSLSLSFLILKKDGGGGEEGGDGGEEVGSGGVGERSGDGGSGGSLHFPCKVFNEGDSSEFQAWLRIS